MAGKERNDNDPVGKLTARERDVLLWSAEGKTTLDMGVLLGISPHTVGEHLKNVRRKLGTVNGAHTIAVAVRLGELDLYRGHGPRTDRS